MLTVSGTAFGGIHDFTHSWLICLPGFYTKFACIGKAQAKLYIFCIFGSGHFEINN